MKIAWEWSSFWVSQDGKALLYILCLLCNFGISDCLVHTWLTTTSHFVAVQINWYCCLCFLQHCSVFIANGGGHFHLRVLYFVKIALGLCVPEILVVMENWVDGFQFSWGVIKTAVKLGICFICSVLLYNLIS